MRRLARLFSVLVLLALIGAAALLWVHPAPPPDRPPDVALSGPRSYHGERREFPWVHPQGRRDIGPDQIDAACSALWRTWGLMLAVVAVIALF